MQKRYNALVDLSFPKAIPNLPFYNLIINVEGDSIGSGYAFDIALVIFNDFKGLWNTQQLINLLSNFGYKELRSCLKIKILDSENGFNEIPSGSQEIGHSLIHILIELIRIKVKVEV